MNLPTRDTPFSLSASPPLLRRARAGGRRQGRLRQDLRRLPFTGVANAPKFGDKAAWAPRIATGKPRCGLGGQGQGRDAAEGRRR
jgi:hypothetical protein